MPDQMWNQGARYALAGLGLLIAIFVLWMNTSFAMLVPALLLILMTHWMAMDSHWRLGNWMLLIQGLLAIVGLLAWVMLKVFS